MTAVSRSVFPSQLANHLVHAINADVAPFIWGSPGIGKSEIIKTVGERMGYHIEDIRLSQIDSIDLRGLPVKFYLEATDKEMDDFNKRNPEVIWAMPDFLVRARNARLNEGKPTLFFLDEMNSAMSSTQAAAFQLVLDKKIGCFKLDDKDRVFAAGNLENDGGITTPMSTPLANRFTHYLLEVSAQEWLEWAVRNDIHPFIISFIEANKSKLHQFNEETINSDEKPFPSPRSWTKFSKLLTSIIDDGHRLRFSMFDSGNNEGIGELSYSEDEKLSDIFDVAAGSVGSLVSLDFMAYVKSGFDLPKPEIILSGKLIDFSSEGDLSKEYLLTNACLFELITINKVYEKMSSNRNDDDVRSDKENIFIENYFKQMSNFIRFTKKNFSQELFIYGIITRMIKTHQIQPLPDLVDEDAFDLVFETFEKFRGSAMIE
jgi:midasin (ATPase involved in ribosome maturation)